VARSVGATIRDHLGLRTHARAGSQGQGRPYGDQLRRTIDCPPNRLVPAKAAALVHGVAKAKGGDTIQLDHAIWRFESGRPFAQEPKAVIGSGRTDCPCSSRHRQFALSVPTAITRMSEERGEDLPDPANRNQSADLLKAVKQNWA
jgi:hypothetical protein